MNFDFSEDQQLLRDQAARFLSERDAVGRSRKHLDDGGGFDAELWSEIANLGWVGAVLPEDAGGAGLGYIDLCVIAEELGRANAAIPFSSSVYLAAEALARFGSQTQQQQWRPRMASGEVVGTLAAGERTGALTAAHVQTHVVGGKISGTKKPVTDAAQAQILITLAREDSGLGLFIVEAEQAEVTCTPLEMNDASRPAAKVVFNGASAERLGSIDGWDAYQELLDRAAVLMAFEQIGGAQACLDMAKSYALERYAFGRPIGSFQAIKHKLADVYIAIELARSNAYFGAWALNAGAAELPVAAAAARVAACRAFELASKENIQTHGGMGFTWELNCHLYYRRAKALGLSLGSAKLWKDKLISRIQARNDA